MMKERIVQALARAEKRGGVKAAQWRLVSGHSSRQERYYVKNDLELAREVEEVRHSLTVYVDGNEGDKKTRGEASITLQPSLSDEEIDSKIAQALSRLPCRRTPGSTSRSRGGKGASSPFGFEAMDETSRAETCRRALFAPEKKPQDPPLARINALELFISKNSKQFINSKGARFDTEEWKGYSEFIVEAEGDSGGVELLTI
jgi:hypothetical protein